MIASAFSLRSEKPLNFKIIKESKRIFVAILISLLFMLLLFYIPILQKFSGLEPLESSEWLLPIAFSFVYFVFLEGTKIVKNLFKKK
jgi:magnesium-transporting ATPase (P-type)